MSSFIIIATIITSELNEKREKMKCATEKSEQKF